MTPDNGFFDNDDPFGLPPLAEGKNAPQEMTVSELSNRLKRQVEEAFSFVRVRGELSRVTVAKSGHLYTDLKDAESVLNSICWKGTLGRLSVKPEEGMEVVCTGRLTTYPGRSNYQLIIETMELAGQGALLKMLEDRRKKLAAEGLFDAARKKPIPFLPARIGVITSPTGAVIRDIMHRLNERFPRRVLLWPVVVQGAGAAQAVAAAIAGFNSIPVGSPDRPDLIIVARGGGSLEDLMPFNDEAVVRAAAASKIPLISAVGHETDTTLIDYAADLRAPTPTAAAEKAVPVRAELQMMIMESGKRLFQGVQNILARRKTETAGLARGIRDPKRGIEQATQKLDHLGMRLDRGLESWLERKTAKLAELTATLTPRRLVQKITDTRRILDGQDERLMNAIRRLTIERAQLVDTAGKMLQSLSFERVLERGYAVVFDDKGDIVSSASALKKGETFDIRFRDGKGKVIAKD